MSMSNTTSQKGQNIYAVAFKINIPTISKNISIRKAIKAFGFAKLCNSEMQMAKLDFFFSFSFFIWRGGDL